MSDIYKIISDFKESTMRDNHRFPGYNYTTEGEDISSLSDAQLTMHYMGLTRLFTESLSESMDRAHSIKVVKEMLLERYEINNSCIWPYRFAPYFTDKETIAFAGYYNEQYRKPSKTYSASQQIEPQDYRNKVKEIENEIERTDDTDEVSSLKNKLVELGWNPEVKYDDETQQKAKERIIKKYEEELHEVFILNCTRDIDTHDRFILPYDENSVDKSNLSSINIIVYEDGHSNIDIDTIKTLDESDQNIEIYSFFMENFNKDADYGAIKNSIGGSVFVLPGNVIASRIIKNIYEMNSYGLGEGYIIPIVKKLYSGNINKCNLEKINEFINTISCKYRYTEPIQEDGIIPFKDYFSINLIH